MVWLAGLLTTLLVLSADFAANQPVVNVPQHVLVGFICLLFAPAFAVFQSFVTARRWNGREIQQHRAAFLYRSLLGSNLIIWLLGCVALMTVAKWPQLIRENWNLNAFPLIDELALALPMLGSILLSWLVVYDAEQALNVSEVKADSAKTERYSLAKRSKLAVQRIRTFSGLVLVPIALLFFGRDIVAIMYPQGLGAVGTCVAFFIFLTALLALYPLLLSATWKTGNVEPDLLLKLKQAADEAGLSNERVRVWDTNGTIVNAIVVGVVPGFRRIFLSDQLLRQFDQDEVVAVYRHEIGHLVHGHLLMRAALILVPLLALASIAMFVNPDHGVQSMNYNAKAVQVCMGLLCAGVFLVYVSQVVSRFVRKSEIQADLFAICRSNGMVCQRRANAYCQALLKMAANCPEMLRRSTSAHPSIQTRIEVIRQVLDQPQRVASFTRRFRQDQQIAAICLTSLVILGIAVSRLF